MWDLFNMLLGQGIVLIGTIHFSLEKVAITLARADIINHARYD